MFALGYEFLNSEYKGKKYLQDLVGKIRDSKVGKDALRVSGITADPKQDEWEACIRRAWAMAAFSHDVGYTIEPGIQLEREFFRSEFFAKNGEMFVNIHRTVLDQLSSPKFNNELSDDEAVVDLIGMYFVRPGSKIVGAGKDLDHGQFLACVVLLSAVDSGQWAALGSLEKLAFFLTLVAVFRHDQWSKPENADCFKKYGDPWSTYFCLIDLLAEIRLIWANVRTDCGRQVSHWIIDIWLPFSRVELAQRNSSCWDILFKANPTFKSARGFKKLAGRDWKYKNFRFAYAAGYGDSEVATRKRGQYREALKELGLLDVVGEVEVHLQ